MLRCNRSLDGPLTLGGTNPETLTRSGAKYGDHCRTGRMTQRSAADRWAKPEYAETLKLKTDGALVADVR
jgi:hypothetical protein